MPIYEYSCAACGPFSDWGRIAESGAPAGCPHCGQSSPRKISAPRLSVIASDLKKAHERNEKSAHEPQHRKKTCHHDHDHTNKQCKVPPGPRRPWMLGH